MKKENDYWLDLIENYHNEKKAKAYRELVNWSLTFLLGIVVGVLIYFF